MNKNKALTHKLDFVNKLNIETTKNSNSFTDDEMVFYYFDFHKDTDLKRFAVLTRHPHYIKEFYAAYLEKARHRKFGFTDVNGNFSEDRFIEVDILQTEDYRDKATNVLLKKAANDYLNFLMKKQSPLITAEKDKKDRVEPQQTIRTFTEEKTQALKEVFISTFNGMGNNNPKYFDENLLLDLRKKRNGIGYAKVALLIYESSKTKETIKCSPFECWYVTFCEVLGIKKCQYRKSQIKIDNTIRNEFYYL